MRATAFGLLPAFLLLSAAAGAGQAASPAHDFFRQRVGLSEEEVASISNGVPVAKVISADDHSTIEIFGAVFVRSTPERYVARATDVESLARMPGYLGAGRLGTPPRLADLDHFQPDPDDVKALRDCQPGDCEVQLPVGGIEEFRKAVDWSAPDAAAQATALARQMALDAVVAYQRGGNAALGVYRDKKDPVRVADGFERLVKTFGSLPVYFPEFERYLLDYPESPLPGVRNDITLKASTQAGLTGLKGSIVRKVAVGRTRSSLEQGLATIKQELER